MKLGAFPVPTFEKVASEFDSEVLEEEFYPLVEAWIGTWVSPSTGPLMLPVWQERLVSAETAEAADDQKRVYKKIIEYAATAALVAAQYNCVDKVIKRLGQIAFGGRFTNVENQFLIDVLAKVAHGMRLQGQVEDGPSDVDRISERTRRLLQAQLTFGDHLQVARKTAEAYYQSKEFDGELSEALKLAQGIRGKKIAFDLEGVLISTSQKLRKHDLISKGLNPDAHIRRPGANEILRALAEPERENQLFIWTAINREYANLLIRNTGLILPGGVQIVSREETLNTFKNEHQEKFLEERGGYYGLREDMEAREALRQIEKGRLKVPQYFPGGTEIDVLLDDNAEFHQKGCQALLGDVPRDVNKIIPVESFSFIKTARLKEHHLDRGLFKVLKRLESVL